MFKKISKLMVTVMGIALLAGCGQKEQAPAAFKPASQIDWIVTSSAGGGSDIFTRKITDIMTKDKIVEGVTFVVNNKTDGNGEIGRNEVANLKGDKANNTLLTFNSGDLMPMVQNTANRSGNFQIIAIMAVDKQLIFKGKASKYAAFKDAIDAAKAGTPVIIGGSKGDDIATYEAMIAEIGLSKDVMKYITYNSTSEAITAILGGHVDLVISKPAAASEYVNSGDLTAILALSDKRYEGNLKDAPTLSEVGSYKNVEVPVWRGVAAPKSMSADAVKYYTEALKKVSDSSTWKTEYIEIYKLISDYKNSTDATTFVKQYESEFMASKGIK